MSEIPSTTEEISIHQLLRNWFQGPLGTRLLDLEKKKINQSLADLFGYHIVQLGCVDTDGLLSSSRITHKVVLGLDDHAIGQDNADLVASGDFLPLDADCMDVVVMPHVLEFTDNPHRILREVARVVIGEGHLVITGFSPWSLWGIWRFFLAWQEQPPWCGHFFRLARLRDWLSLLDFELVSVEKYFFRPPIKHNQVMNKLVFLEQLGKYCWPWWGGAYIIVARKRVIPLTPMKVSWSDKRRLVNSGLAEPSTRVGNSM